MVPNREYILGNLSTLNVEEIINAINCNVITINDVETILGIIGGHQDKISLIKLRLTANNTDLEWDMASTVDSIESYHQFITQYPQSPHIPKAVQRLQYFEPAFWESIKNNLTIENLNKYLLYYPNSTHSQLCQSYLNDTAWLNAMQLNTIAAYNEYAMHNPGKHVAEIKEAIDNLNDDIAWEEASRLATDEAIAIYIRQHPTGKYIAQANTALQNRKNVGILLNEIKNNTNQYSVGELQQKVNNMQLKYDDLKAVFNDSQVDAIKFYTSPSDLPKCPPPDYLVGNSTEVFFWGTPASGKTCALGAILSAAKRYGILKSEDGAAGFYRDLLCNIFVNNGICVLPYGSSDDSVAEMGLSLRDKNDKYHRLTFVDLAGEVFRAMYRRLHNLPEDNFERERTLTKILEYLNDNRNPKIHYFIIPYGEVNNIWPDDTLKMADYLNASMEYLVKRGIIHKGTNGVYILVTKSDKMPCSPEQRKDYAKRYIMESLPAFYNNLRVICEKAGVADFDIIPFTLGDVFAQNLCIFDRNNTDEILNTLIAKGEVKAVSWWEKLKIILRG